MDTELDETAQLQAQLEESERERDQFKAMALRYKADLDNYKKRAAQEMEGEQRPGRRRSFSLKLVTVADDFSRAVNHLPEDAVDPSWYEGIQLVQRSMESMLQSEGLSRIEAAIGQPFDVYEHEAVFFEPTDEVEEGAVVRVIRDGYKLRNRVLRAAQVSVAQAPPESIEHSDSESETQQQEAQ